MKKSAAPIADSSRPIAGLPRPSKRAKSDDDLSQAEKFEQAAREHGTDGDKEAFKGVLRKLAVPRKVDR